MPLLDLPDELLTAITTWIERRRHLNQLARTCRRLYSLANLVLYRVDHQSNYNDALEWAATHGNLGTLRTVAASGALISSVDKPLLHLAIANNNENVLEALISQYQVKQTLFYESRESPLVHAAKQTHGGAPSMVRLLLQHGATAKEQNGLKRTALHMAAATQHVEMAKLLVDAGADVNAQDMGEATPLHLAALADQADMAAFLLEMGADASIKDGPGRTALDLARSSGHHKTENVIIRRGA